MDRGGSRVDAVCVFCGSSAGLDPAHAAMAREVGRTLADHGVRLVYGGGAVGLMGCVADAALEAGGEVVGVIPRGLFRREVGHQGLSELVEVDSMHDRKRLMFELSDGFVAMPGGLGTLEELSEILTWAQLGLHGKPIVTLGPAGFWRPWHGVLDHLVASGFVQERYAKLVKELERVDELMPALRAGPGKPSDRWIDLAET